MTTVRSIERSLTLDNISRLRACHASFLLLPFLSSSSSLLFFLFSLRSFPPFARRLAPPAAYPAPESPLVSRSSLPVIQFRRVFQVRRGETAKVTAGDDAERKPARREIKRGRKTKQKRAKWRRRARARSGKSISMCTRERCAI